MNKLAFFLAAMKADEHRRRAWVFSAFTMTAEDPDEWKKRPYAYRIVQTPTGHFFVDPDNNMELSPIEGSKAGEPPFSVNEHIQLIPGDVPNLKKTVETSYGNLLFNYVAIVWALNSKIEFQTGRISPSQMEDLILPRLKDTPKDPSTRKDEDIYVDEYLNFCDAMFYLAGFTQICVPAATEKSLVPPPGLKELKDKLFKQYEGRLNDPTVQALISAELVKFDKEYLKGDPSEGFLLGGKSFNVVRKKMFGTLGGEVGLDESVQMDVIKNSLSEGWDISKFPAMNNSLRAGSYNRGAQTMLGGESVKWLLRASSNITVTQDDCGTTLGMPEMVTNENFKKLVGFSIVEGKSTKKIASEEEAGAYLGKKIIRRSPQFCSLDKTDFCKVCVGDRLAENPTGLSAAISEYGSAFLSIYMAAAHGKALLLAHMDYKTALQ
jgi:hypothetical protein